VIIPHKRRLQFLGFSVVVVVVVGTMAAVIDDDGRRRRRRNDRAPPHTYAPLSLSVCVVSCLSFCSVAKRTVFTSYNSSLSFRFFVFVLFSCKIASSFCLS
jgi:hypothetical protein